MTSETGDVRSISAALDGVWRVFSDLRMTVVLVALAVLSAAARSDTPALRVLLALLAFNLLLQLALQVERAARLRSSSFPPPVPAAIVEVEPILLMEAAQVRAEAVWRRTFSRVLVAEPPDAALYGARRRAGVAGPLLAITGALLFLAGLWLNAARGWSEEGIVLTADDEVPLAQLAGATLMLEPATAGISQPIIALTRPATGSRRFRITPGKPARAAAGLWLIARTGGPTLEVTGRDGAGLPLDLLPAEPGADQQPALSLPFPPAQAEQAFSVPAKGLVFRAVSYPSLPERGVQGPVFLVEAFHEGDAAPEAEGPPWVASALVQDGAEMNLDGSAYTLRRGRYLDVRAAYLPGWPLLAAGAVLTLVGSLLAAFLDAREGWVTLPGGRSSSVEDPRQRDGAASGRVQTVGGLTPRRDARSLADQLGAGSAAVSMERDDR